MIFPIKIPIELVELIKFVLPELIFIVVASLAAISFVTAIFCMVVHIRKTKKIKETYLSFSTKEEWEDFKRRYGEAFVEELMKLYDLYPKDRDPRKKLCGVWCNEDDSLRYYITDNNGFYTFMIEHRPAGVQETMILRATSDLLDNKSVFIADGSELITLTIGYDKGEDTLFIAGRHSSLIRIEEYMKRRKTTPKSPIESEMTICDVEFAD